MDRRETARAGHEKTIARKRRRRRSVPIMSLLMVVVCGLLLAWVIEQTDRIATTGEDLELVHKFVLATAETHAQLFEFQKHERQDERGKTDRANPGNSGSSEAKGSSALSVSAKKELMSKPHSGLLPIAGERTGPGTAFPHAPRGRWLQTKPGQPFVWKAEP